MIAEDLGVPRDSTDRFNMATLLLVDDRGYVRQKYLASSEHEIGDAVEDIALLKKRKLEARKANLQRLETGPCRTSATAKWSAESGAVDTLFHTIPEVCPDRPARPGVQPPRRGRQGPPRRRLLHGLSDHLPGHQQPARPGARPPAVDGLADRVAS